MMSTETPSGTEIEITDEVPAHVDVEIPAEKPVEAAAAPAPAAKPAILEPDEGIAKLQRQLEAEKQAKQAAEARARQAEAERTRAQSESEDSQRHMVSTAIASVTQALDLGEQQLADAMTQQDYARVAKIQREISVNAAKLQALESGKAQMEQRPKREAPRAADPVEALASQLQPKAANWLRAHPECASGAMNQKMMAGHYDALSEGYPEGSDEYFAHIETRLGFRQPERVADPEPPRAQPRRTPASAPVSRSGAGPGDRPNVVRLSREEVEMAEAMKMTPQEYAQNKYALKREGKLN